MNGAFNIKVLFVTILICVSGCKKQAYKVDENLVGEWQSWVSLTESYYIFINNKLLGSSYVFYDQTNQKPPEDFRGTARINKKKNILIIGDKELSIVKYPTLDLTDTLVNGSICNYWHMTLDDRIYLKKVCD